MKNLRQSAAILIMVITLTIHVTLATASGGTQPPRPVLGRPTDTSVAISVIFLQTGSYYIEYTRRGTSGGVDVPTQTPTRVVAAGDTRIEELQNLVPDSSYQYVLFFRAEGQQGFVSGDAYRFSTSRHSGVGYMFAVEADPHFDENFDASTYAETLTSILQANPDFMIDLGDASMIEKLAPSAAGAAQRYQIVRSWWEQIGGSVPIYMALGNHDGENGISLQGSTGSFGLMAARLRQSLFPAPVPGAFYTGNQAGTYYSFEWGDALFVVLDPFSYTMRKPRELDFWSWTLGKAQYDWLQDILEHSQAAYKFVFIHHLVGGVNKDTRGGIAIAPYFEWGGLNSEGVNMFGTERPGWQMPIKDLLEKYKVDIVFHGHDHFYAREQLGGVIYQLVPQPGQPKARMSSKQAAGWGYTTGTALPSPGFLSVEVTPQAATVSYVQSGTVVDSYVIKP